MVLNAVGVQGAARSWTQAEESIITEVQLQCTLTAERVFGVLGVTLRAEIEARRQRRIFAIVTVVVNCG